MLVTTWLEMECKFVSSPTHYSIDFVRIIVTVIIVVIVVDKHKYVQNVDHRTSRCKRGRSLRMCAIASLMNGVDECLVRNYRYLIHQTNRE